MVVHRHSLPEDEYDKASNKDWDCDSKVPSILNCIFDLCLLVKVTAIRETREEGSYTACYHVRSD